MEESNWYDQPDQSPQSLLGWISQQNQKLGTAVVQGVTEGATQLAGWGADQAKRVGTELMESAVKPRTPVEQTIETGINLGTAGIGDIPAELILSNLDKLPENLRIPGAVAGLLVGGVTVKGKTRAVNLLEDRLKTIKSLKAELPDRPIAKSIEARKIKDLNKENDALNRTLADVRVRGDEEILDQGTTAGMIKASKSKEATAFRDAGVGSKIGAIGHHSGPLLTSAIPWSKMDVAKGIEVENILLKRWDRKLGHSKENITPLWSGEAHTYLAHPQGYSDPIIRSRFNKFDWKNATAKEAADFIELQQRHFDANSSNAFYSRANIDAGMALWRELPENMQNQLPRGFNPLNPNEDPEAYRDYLLFLENQPVDVRKRIREATQNIQDERLMNNDRFLRHVERTKN